MQSDSLNLHTEDGKIVSFSPKFIEFSKLIKNILEGNREEGAIYIYQKSSLNNFISKNLISLPVCLLESFVDLSIDAEEEDEIPVCVNYQTLAKIKEFFEHHEYKDIKSVKKPIKTSNYSTIASDWDGNFFKSMSEEDLAELLQVREHRTSLC